MSNQLKMKVFLETERLILRQFTTDDVDNLVALDSDVDVMRFINGGVPSTYQEIAAKFLPDVLSYYDKYDNLGFWAIVKKSSPEFIGWVVLRPESRFRLAKIFGVADDALELGYRLHKISWGKGYATEASLAVIKQVCNSNKYKKIVAWALPENTASINVMQKLGMTLQQEYTLTAADVLPHIELLESPVIQNLLDRKIVKYQLSNNKLI